MECLETQDLGERGASPFLACLPPSWTFCSILIMEALDYVTEFLLPLGEPEDGC